MRKMNRRQFAKAAGAAALVPAVIGVRTLPEAGGSEDSPLQQPAGAAPAAAKPKLTPEQEEKVKQALERRERQLAGLRSRTLPYGQEPAFVFKARTRLGGKEGKK